MKRLFFVIALLPFIAMPVIGQKKLTEVDLRVNSIGSGSSYSSTIAKFGPAISRKVEKTKAEDSCTATDDTYMTLRYSGMTVGLLGDGNGRNLTVVEIVVTSKRWQASGIRVGATPKEVIRRFGEPVSRAKRGSRANYDYVTPENLGGVHFEFLRGRLLKIIMSETLC
jgi:hypothetical protein